MAKYAQNALEVVEYCVERLAVDRGFLRQRTRNLGGLHTREYRIPTGAGEVVGNPVGEPMGVPAERVRIHVTEL